MGDEYGAQRGGLVILRNLGKEKEMEVVRCVFGMGLTSKITPAITTSCGRDHKGSYKFNTTDIPHIPYYPSRKKSQGNKTLSLILNNFTAECCVICYQCKHTVYG